MPKNISLNWFMPAFVKSSVGSSLGTKLEEDTTSCPLAAKKSRNLFLISFSDKLCFLFIAVQNFSQREFDVSILCQYLFPGETLFVYFFPLTI